MTSLPRRCRARSLLPLVTGALLCAATGAHAQPAQPAGEIIYRAERGDTLTGIGNRLLERPRDWREVARLNRIPDPDRIMPAQPIRIPLRLLRGVPAPARVVETVGEVRLTGSDGIVRGAARDGEIAEGVRIATGADGYLTLRLADGSLLRVQAATEAELAQARSIGRGAEGGHRTLLQLIGGRLEALVTQVTGGAPRFEVRTPQAVVGVRGTEFRVGVDAGSTRGEVLAGTVGVGAAAATGNPGGEVALGAGFGTVSDGRKVLPPVALLPAPAVAALPVLLERVLVRLQLPPLDGAARWRAQVAFDPQFQQVAAEGVFESPELRFSTLEDADYALRVRAIDAQGIEGRDAVHHFTLKARPEPPATTAPTPRARLPVGPVEFAWAAHPQAKHYRFQLARTPDFAAPERSLDAVDGSALSLDGLAAGIWHWRVATVRAGKGGDDRGPWGDPQTVDLRALPRPPAPARVDDARVRLAWGGEPGQRFDFQLARDAAFTQIEIERQLAEPAIEFARPAPGVYHLRYRAIDADGYVGPFIAPQLLQLFNCVRDSAGRCIASGADALRAP